MPLNLLERVARRRIKLDEVHRQPLTPHQSPVFRMTAILLPVLQLAAYHAAQEGVAGTPDANVWGLARSIDEEQPVDGYFESGLLSHFPLRRDLGRLPFLYRAAREHPVPPVGAVMPRQEDAI